MSNSVRITWYGDQRIAEVKAEVEKRLVKAAIFLKREIQQELSVACGRKGKRRIRSKPGEMPRKDHGELRRSITYTKDGMKIYIGTNKLYAKYLEFGTSKMKPRPFMRPAMMKHREKIKDIITGRFN